MCHHEASWHAYDVTSSGGKSARVVCMLCTIENPDEPPNLCWEGKRS